jgi:UDP-2,3-diacylglucosamine hydrolase
MSAIFFSDVHLHDGDSLKTRLVMRFLEEVAARHERIFVLGDLFDVWPGTTRYLKQRFRPVLDTFRALVKTGHDVNYVEGNHDFRLGEFFQKELGVRVHPDGLEERFGDRRAFLAHGDLGNPDDRHYPRLRRVLRSDVLHGTMRLVPDRLTYEMGAMWSRWSRAAQERRPWTESRKEQIRSIYRRSAEESFRRGFDLVFYGHTHLPDDHRATVDGRECRYVNLGDWVRHFTYLEFDGTDFYTKVHPVKDDARTLSQRPSRGSKQE